MLYEVVSKRSSVIESSLSIDDLNHVLDELAQNMGKQYVTDTCEWQRPHLACRDVQSKILQHVYNRSTAEEQRWIIRIILKGSTPDLEVDTTSHRDSEIDMQISVKETTVLSVFHPDAQDLYNTCSDLKKVAWELWDPSFRLNAEVGSHNSLRSRTQRKDRTRWYKPSTLLPPCCVSVLLGGSRTRFAK